LPWSSASQNPPYSTLGRKLSPIGILTICAGDVAALPMPLAAALPPPTAEGVDAAPVAPLDTFD
jgi:hypothetical protein